MTVICPTVWRLLLQYLCRPELDFRSADLDRDRRDDFFAPPPSRRRSDRTGGESRSAERRFELREPDDLCDERFDDRERERERERERRLRFVLAAPPPPPLRLWLPRDDELVELLVELSTTSGWSVALPVRAETEAPTAVTSVLASSVAALAAVCPAAGGGTIGAALARGSP